jgi:hypothetical protein
MLKVQDPATLSLERIEPDGLPTGWEDGVSVIGAGNRELEEPLLKRAKLQGPEVSDARRRFAVLPPQDMRLGSRVVRKLSFVTPASGSHNVPDRDEDGILATVLFQRVYISHSDRFVIFDPCSGVKLTLRSTITSVHDPDSPPRAKSEEPVRLVTGTTKR